MKPVTAARSTVLALLALALWNPPLMSRQGTMDIAVVDLTGNPSAASPSPITELENTLASVNLEANWHPITAGVAAADTSINAAWQSLAATSTHPLLLLIAEDAADRGISNALQQSHAAGVTNFWVPKPPSGPLEAISIIAVNAPARAQGLTQIPVTVHVAANRPGRYQVQARLATNNAEQVISLGAGQQQTLRLWLQGSAGNHQLTVSVHDPEQRQPPVAEYHHGITIEGAGTLLLISDRHQQLPGLPAAYRDQRRVSPALFMSNLSLLQAATTIVLDNIAIDDLPPQAWALLEQQVRRRGAAAWVLGGDNSFSAGGYRGSALERQLLPVLSEPGRQEPAAAVIFLIDHSGSMGAGDGNNMALSMANRAVAASVAALGTADQIGLVEFADSAKVLAAPGSHSHTELPQLLTLQASGGTQLAAGLEQALAQLQQTELEQRLLVLVTDGFSADIDSAHWRRQLRDAGVTLVALAVGSAPNTTILEQLAWSADSRVLTANSVSDLPRLMSSAVATQRNPARGATTVIQRRPLGSKKTAYEWPEVTRWQATRAKSGARIILVAASGEPLVADVRVGAGRVLALPAGLYEGVPAWQPWPQLPSVMKELLRLGGTANKSSNNSLAITQLGRGLRAVAEISPVKTTESDSPVQLTIYAQDAPRRNLTMPAMAAELYTHTVAALPTGQYLLQVKQGELEIEQAYYHQPIGELRAAREAGLLKLWTKSALSELTIDNQQHGARWLALLAAMLVYLTSVWLESGKPGISHRSPPR